MPCCGGDVESSKQNNRIEKELKDYKRSFDQEVKLLLLGRPYSLEEFAFTHFVFSFSLLLSQEPESLANLLLQSK
jgi:hypothetical protein